MRAYDETYLAGAQRRLGAMLDVAVNGYACDLGAFYERFLTSPTAVRFEAGEWASGAPFASIQELVPIDEVRSMYRPYHEMDVRQFCDKMDELRREAQPRTNLQARRLAASLSQSQLARAAGIPVRTLQQYEQRQKDVNHARADYLVALSRALCYQPADLLECKAGPLIEYAMVSL